MNERSDVITLTIDGLEARVPPGATLWEAARTVGVEIPTLCHGARMQPVGVCRMCVVDIGERVLAAACSRKCDPGMTVQTATEEIEQHRRMLTALLLAEYPARSAREETTGDDALLALGQRYGFQPGLLETAPEGNRIRDASSPVIAVDHRACILCDRCIRACNEIQHNDIIGRTGKGYRTRIGFDLDEPMGKSGCVACGECLAVCPTGALTNKALSTWRIERSQPTDRTT